MKKILLFTLLLIFISLGSNVFAQVTITLGDGTATNTTTGTPTPYGTYYKNFRQQYLVLATELNDIGGGPGDINSIAFNVENVNECSPMPNFRIRIKETTLTALTTTFEAGPYEQVFVENDFLPTTGWNVHTFSTPFNWDGSSNLIIDIVTDLIPGQYTQNASVFYTPTSFNSCLRYQSDSSPAIDATTGTTSVNRANIQFNMEALDITDIACLSVTGPTTPNVNTTVTYAVSVKNYSQDPLSTYTVKLMQAGEVEIGSVAGTTIQPQETLSFDINWTPTVVGETQLYGKVVMTGDENPGNDESAPITVTVMESGLLVASIGNGTEYNSTTGTPTPYGTYYKNFRQQYLYKADDFYAAGAAPGMIQALAFNVHALNGCSPMPNFTIRLKHTDAEALTTTFETGEYTTVKTYPEFMPTNDWNLHNFDTPFFWDGASNVIVEIVTDLIPGNFTENASVYHTSTPYISSLRYQSDSSPAVNSTTGSTASLLANIRFFMIVEGMGSLNGTVTAGGSPLEGAEIVVENTVFSTISGADGSYNIPYVPEGTQTVTATKHGYSEVSHVVTIVEDEATTQDFVLTLLPQVTVSGRIVGSDNPTMGIEGATITLSGYEPYEATTDATGNFTIENVFANQTYNYTAMAIGYASATGQLVVGGTNVDMGDITLSEIAYPPYGVVATESNDNASVSLEWQVPVPGGSSFEDSFEEYNDFAIEFGEWTLVDVDQSATYGFSGITFPNSGTAMSYIIFNPNNTTPPLEDNPAVTGDKYAACFASTTPPNNDWMITPQVMGGGEVRFWARTYMPDYGLERFNVGVSTTGTNPADFTIISGPTYVEAPIEWTEYVYDLSAYAGQQIYVGLQCVSNDAFIFFVDDFYVGDDQVRLTSSREAKIAPNAPHIDIVRNADATRSIVTPNPVKIITAQPRNAERSLTGYKVYRLLAADQDNEANWTTLTPSTITPTEYQDNTWGPLPSGVYKYAVKAVYTNDVMSNAAFSNELHKGMMGTLTGVVTEFGTGLPIEGATITAGDYSGTTNADGEYSFAVYAGTYTVTASKAGYESATENNVVIVGTETTTLDFTLTEITLPPAAVQAEEAGNNVNITWMAPGTAGGDWIHYDSGENYDSIGLTSGGEFAVAIRFPASALTNYAGMSLHAISLFPGDIGTYSLRVWTGGTAAAPGVQVVNQPFTVAAVDEFQTVMLDNPVLITGNEELWFGYNVVHSAGTYPAGCDEGPANDGFGNMIYSSGSWTTLLAMASTLNYNWNIQGYVGYSAPDRGEMIALNARVNQEQQNADRSLEGYKVWRLLQGQESNEAQWIALTQDPISATAFQDTDWGVLPDGTYKWAVKAVYTGGALSNAAFSNAIERITEIGTVAGFVRNMDNEPIIGATITSGDYSTTSNNNGAYTMNLPAGTHSVTASHPNYSAVTQTGVVVVTGQITTVNFQLPASEVIFEDDFESYQDFSLTFAPWILLDNDQSATYGFSGITFPNSGSAMAYIIFNPDATTPPLEENPPHSGAKMAASFAATTPPNNDWMITPQINGGGDITFWARTYMPDYGLERFKVGVSTTGTNPNDFTFISGPTYVEAPVEWTEFNYSLANYAGQDIHVGIQCLSNDAFIFFVDDVTISGPVPNEDVVTPVYTTELKGNYPNPFNPETTIHYSVKENSPVTIDIFNVKGQRVRRLVNETVNAGEHTVIWNGTDENGRSVSSGIYYFKMNAGKYSSTRKMIMMK
nr:hypothetical protein [Candidatus Cloacimonadota bacterium]